MGEAGISGLGATAGLPGSVPQLSARGCVPP